MENQLGDLNQSETAKYFERIVNGIIKFILIYFIFLPFVSFLAGRVFLPSAAVTSETQNTMKIINTKVPRNIFEFALTIFTSLSNLSKKIYIFKNIIDCY